MMRIILIVGLLFSNLTIASDNFGRLFTTPVERANLDYLRKTSTQANSAKEKEDVTETSEIEPAHLPASVSMQGYVKRSDGKKGTVWLNHQPVQENSNNGELQIGRLGRDSNEVQLSLPNSGKNFRLKAGQVYSPETNAVSDLHVGTGDEGDNK